MTVRYSAAVGQRSVLSRLFGEALETVRPGVVLVLDCSTGNGLEHVNPAATSRVVVVDINPTYLRRLRDRFPNPSLELDVAATCIPGCRLKSAVMLASARKGRSGFQRS